MGRLRDFLLRIWGRGTAPDAADSQLDSTVEPAWLVVGLGNPGPKYAATRHNVGFRVLDHLAGRVAPETRWQLDRELDALVARIPIAGENVLLLKPQTVMNRSGKSVAIALERWSSLDPTTNLIVVYDDLDLPTGRIRLRPKGGGGGHRGIGDILSELDTREISRLRFGIGHPGAAGAVLEWVLEAFPVEEESEILPGALARAADAIEVVIREGVPAAMGQFNAAS